MNEYLNKSPQPSTYYEDSNCRPLPKGPSVLSEMNLDDLLLLYRGKVVALKLPDQDQILAVGPSIRDVRGVVESLHPGVRLVRYMHVPDTRVTGSYAWGSNGATEPYKAATTQPLGPRTKTR